MARTSAKKTTRCWTDALDPADVEDAAAEACIDANGEDEQHTGLLTAIGDELQFPFQARVLGLTIQVVDMQWPEHDSYGLDLVCEIEGAHHLIEARSVDLLPPLPEGHLFLAAYLDWKGRL